LKEKKIQNASEINKRLEMRRSWYSLRKEVST